MGKRRIFATVIAADLFLIMLAVNAYAAPGGTGTIIRQAGAVSILPGTGGIGSTIFYIAGISIMTGAVIFLLIKRKRDI